MDTAMQKKRGAVLVPDRAVNRIVASGQVFVDGTGIELVRDVEDAERPSLLFWDGAQAKIAPVVEHLGQIYEPPILNGSIWRELVLPTRVTPCRSVRELLQELCQSASQLVGLPEKPAAIVGRAVLDSWVIRALSLAPALSIIGPDGPRALLLLQWLRCVCRRALSLSGVSPAALRSLASGLEFTVIMNQPTIGNTLEKLLDEAARRDQKILHRGNLLDLFGLQIVYAESVIGAGASFRSLRVPTLPGNGDLPAFDASVQERIASDFQARLLGYRFANFQKISAFQFDAPRLTPSLRELARSLAAITPDDADLQAEVFDLLQSEDNELRSEKWISADTALIETVLVACREWAGEEKYVADLATISQEILRRRGANVDVDPGIFGKRLNGLGFTSMKERDAKGVALKLSDATQRRAEQLARDFNIPEVERGGDWFTFAQQNPSEMSTSAGRGPV
jgi:hypothetical protein